jgi:hypothetical protein
MNPPLRRQFVALAFLLFVACQKETPPQAMRKSETDLKGTVRTTLDSPAPTPAQLARRRRSGEVVRKLGLPVSDSLPVTEDEATVTPRSSEEIASRCIAPAICAVKGEEDDPKLIADLVKRFDAKDLFSPLERAYLAKQPASQKDRANFGWRYECVHVFLWALGYIEDLNPPDEIADAGKLVGAITKQGRAGLARDARPRSLSEVLEQADLYYRLHWAAIELRLQGRPSPKANEEIIVERPPCSELAHPLHGAVVG